VPTNLSDAKIKNAKPEAKPYKLTDIERKGLSVLVTPATPRNPKGTRLWRWRYFWGGKEKVMTLGTYPEVGLAEARKRHEDHRRTLAEGRDPAAEKQVTKLLGRLGSSRSFETIARDWYALRAPNWSPIYAQGVLAGLEVDVFPAIGKMDVDRITAPMVVALLRAIEARPAIAIAKRVRSQISAVFGHAIATGIGQNDPAAIVKGALATQEPDRMPAIIELPALVALLRKVDDYFGFPVTKAAVRFLSLTLARPRNLRYATWDQLEGFDGNNPIWRVPAGEMKARREWVCPLPGPAIDVIQALRPLTGRSRFVFPNHRDPHRPMSEDAINVLMSRVIGHRGLHCAHGFRSSFSSIMNEKHPEDSDAIEAQLAHKVRGVRGAYMRAPFLERRIELLGEWAGLLMAGAKDGHSLLLGPRHN
jgi:integrase